MYFSVPKTSKFLLSFLLISSQFTYLQEKTKSVIGRLEKASSGCLNISALSFAYRNSIHFYLSTSILHVKSTRWNSSLITKVIQVAHSNSSQLDYFPRLNSILSPDEFSNLFINKGDAILQSKRHICPNLGILPPQSLDSFYLTTTANSLSLSVHSEKLTPHLTLFLSVPSLLYSPLFSLTLCKFSYSSLSSRIILVSLNFLKLL